MAVQAAAGEDFTVSCTAAEGLEDVGVTIYAADGETVVVERVVEQVYPVAVPGVGGLYVATLTAPLIIGEYVVGWDFGVHPQLEAAGAGPVVEPLSVTGTPGVPTLAQAPIIVSDPGGANTVLVPVSNAVPGNSLVLYVVWYPPVAGPPAELSVSDDGGNDWKLIGDQVAFTSGGATSVVALFRCDESPGGNFTITVASTINSHAGGGAAVTVLEFQSLGDLDKTAVSFGAGDGSNIPIQSAILEPTQAGDLALITLVPYAQPTSYVGAPWMDITGARLFAVPICPLAIQVCPDTNPVSGTWSAASTAWVTIGAAFKALGAALPPPPPTAVDPADLLVLVPWAIRACEGPYGAPADKPPLTSDQVYPMVADACAEIVLFSGTLFGHPIEVLARDPTMGFPIAWGTTTPLDQWEGALIICQVTLNYFFYLMRDMKTSETIQNEGSEWSYTLSAGVIKNYLDALRAQRDLALAGLVKHHPTLDRYASNIRVRDQATVAVLEWWDTVSAGVSGGVGMGGGQEAAVIPWIAGWNGPLGQG